MYVITLILSDAPYFIVTIPIVFQIYIINNDIEGNKSGVAILDNTTLGICRTRSMQQTFTGKHCDRKIPHEMLIRGCGCWGTSGIVITNLDLLYCCS